MSEPYCTPKGIASDVRHCWKKFNSKGSLFCGLLVVGMLLTVILLPLSLKRLESTQYGIEYDTVAKDVGGIEGEGLHAGPVGFKFITFPAVYKTEQLNVTCITRDGLFVNIFVSFQFLAEKKQLQTIIRKYRDYGKFRTIVRAAATSAVHSGCSQFLMEEYQSKRAAVQNAQFQDLKVKLAPLGASSVDLQLKNVNPPSAWSNAVQEKEKAREDIDLAQNERQQQLIIANTTLNVASQQAQITLANATTTAKVSLLKANATAETILNALKSEADTLGAVKKALSLSVPGLLTYLSNRALENRELNLAVTEPAKFSYRDEL